MKKNKLLLPVVACLALLVGCSNAPKLSVKNEEVTTKEGDTYQDIFNKLYDESGVSTATKELLVEVADYVLGKSDFWTKATSDPTYKTVKELEIHNRVVEKFNDFYTSTYKEDGLFDEDLLAQGLREDGYTIVTEGKTAFKETVSTLVGHKDLYELLGYDYSDWEKAQEREIKLDLLKEEYVRTQKGQSDGAINTTYYTNKKFREVKYFSVSVEDSAERLKYSPIFAQKVTDNFVENVAQKDFEKLVEEDLEVVWKIKKLEDLAEEFAMINKVAKEEGKAVYEAYPEYALPEAYQEAVKTAEVTTYAKDFRDIYSYEDRKELGSEKVTEAQEKLSSYSDSGKQSIYKGYYLKQLEIITTKYYTETVYSTDSSNVINTATTTAIKNFSETKYSSKGNVEGECYIDPSDNSNIVYKDGTTCYIIVASKLDNDAWNEASDESIIKANRNLAKTSSNVSNCWYYYLTELNDSKEFEVNWKEIYESLNETYSYGEDD